MFNLESMIAGLLNRYKSTQLFAVIVTIFMALMGGIEFAIANNYIAEGSFGEIVARVLQVFVFIKGVLMQMDLPIKKGHSSNPVLDNFLWILFLAADAIAIRLIYLKLFVCASCVPDILTIVTFILLSLLILLISSMIVYIVKARTEV